MHTFFKKGLVIMCTFLIIMASTCDSISADAVSRLREQYTYGRDGANDVEYETWLTLPYYSSFLKMYEENGYNPAAGEKLTLSPENITVGKDTGGIQTGEPAAPYLKNGVGGLDKPVFVWDDSIPWAEWEFDVVSPGLYEIEINYYMMQGTGNPAVRALTVDGDAMFLESNNIVFPRMWKDAREPIINNLGDEVRPRQMEVPGWRSLRLTDSTGYYAAPFSFYFESGRHKIRLEYIDQDMAISEVSIVPATVLPTYDEVRREYERNNYRNASENITFEAETTVILKSSPTIRRESNGDPLASPPSKTNRKLNVMGGYTWRKGNQSITWEFTVPEDGLYTISLRQAQEWNDGLPSYRQIAIDGKIPFQELAEYRFPYRLGWEGETLSDENGEPFLFYLTSGVHTLTMSVKMGKLTPVIQSLNEDAIVISNMLRQIRKITGKEPDPNYDYKFFQTIPGLKETMEELMGSLQYKYDYLKSIAEKTPAMANNFMAIKKQLASMIKDPFTIARQVNDMENAMGNLSTWYLSLQDQPLVIDYFVLGSPGEKWICPKSNIFQVVWALLKNFFISFSKDYDNIGSILSEDTQVNTSIDVWVARGTEWAALIKEMADEEFTPETGIMVNINVIPASQLNAGTINALMLSIASGKAPDVALGTDWSSPVEFAIRDAALDLCQMDGFDEVKTRFIEEIFTPFRYQGGVYALPETMDFLVMYYRKDILSELGIILPDTWEELYSYVLPALYQNGMEFYYPQDYMPFLFQKGGSLYSDNGLYSALDMPQAFQAFREYTELFTHYGVPPTANFFNRFRSGEMPMGILGYNTYMQLSVAAPELAGKWGIAMIPGMKNQKGVIDRSHASLAAQCDIILKQTEHPEEAWEFLKWWTSESVQTRFAREIEALVGVEARWNTANVKAFTSLAWDRSHLGVIKEQWQWARGTPVVLGGYYTGRYITNAWVSVVIDGKRPRDALENSIKEINRELRMKQEEYGIFANR